MPLIEDGQVMRWSAAAEDWRPGEALDAMPEEITLGLGSALGNDFGYHNGNSWSALRVLSGTAGDPASSAIPTVNIQIHYRPNATPVTTNFGFGIFGYRWGSNAALDGDSWATANFVSAVESFSTAAPQAGLYHEVVAGQFVASARASSKASAVGFNATAYLATSTGFANGGEFNVNNYSGATAPLLTTGSAPYGTTKSLSLVGTVNGIGSLYNSGAMAILSTGGISAAFRTGIYFGLDSIADGYGIDLINVGVGSSTGDPIRFGNNTFLVARNFADSADQKLIGQNASNEVLIAGDSQTTVFGGSLLPSTTLAQSIGSLEKRFLSLHAAELFVQTLISVDTLSTVGGRAVIGPGSTYLVADADFPSVTIDVKHNTFAIGDRIYLEKPGQVEFMAVTSGPLVLANGYRYGVTRNLDGSGSNNWITGDSIVNTGTTGSGFIDVYAIRGIKSANEAGPTMVGNVRNSGTYNDWSPHWAIGNLKDLYGYSSITYGAAFGKYDAGAAHVTIDATNGYRTFAGLSTVVQQIDNSGNVTVGQVTAAKSNVLISSAGAVQLRNNLTARISLAADGSGFLANSLIAWDTSGNLTITGNAVIGGVTIGSGKMYVGTGTFANPSTGFYVDSTGSFSLKDKLTWNGTTLTIVGGGTFSGALSAATGTFAGSLSAATGTFAGSLSAATGTFAGSLSAATGTFAGSLSAATGTFAGSLSAATGSFSGTVTATAGSIGGFDIGSDYLRDTGNSFGLASTITGGDDVRFWAGSTFANRATAPFRLTEAGVLTVTSGSISGRLEMSGASSAIALGNPAPTAVNSGTGLWLDRDGLRSLNAGVMNLLLGATGLNLWGPSLSMQNYAGTGNTQLTTLAASGGTIKFQQELNTLGSGNDAILEFTGTSALDSAATLLAIKAGSFGTGSVRIWGSSGAVAGLIVGADAAPRDAFDARFTDTTGSYTGYAVQNLGSGANSYSGMLYYDNAGNLSIFQGFRNTTGEFRFNNIAANGFISFLISGAGLTLTNAKNLKLGGTALRGTTEGTNHIDIFNGTAPVGLLSNGISIYASAGEGYMMDAAGNATLQTPHDRITNEWIFFSKNTRTGKVLRIDMERLMRTLDKQLGGGFVHDFATEAEAEYIAA